MAEGRMRLERLLSSVRESLHPTQRPDVGAALRWLDEVQEHLRDQPLFTEADLGAALSALARKLGTATRRGDPLTVPVLKRLIGEVMHGAGANVQLWDPAKVSGLELDKCAEAYGLKRRGQESDESLRERIEAEAAE